MTKKIKVLPIILMFFTFALLVSSGMIKGADEKNTLRKFADKVGFAQYEWQVEKLMKMIKAEQGKHLKKAFDTIGTENEKRWKVVISPHDDHCYVGYLYPAILKDLRAKTVILFGVAHKAKDLGLEDKLIFDEYINWHAPYGPVKVSSVRDELLADLPSEIAAVNNKMHKIEHSLEALIPFIQYYNEDVEIIPILVPYMNFDRILLIGEKFANSLKKIIEKRNWEWGKDFAIAISSDSVHYGDRDWGGKDFARFGTDKKGYEKAIKLEKEIINNCLTGKITKRKMKTFTEYTVKPENHKEYKWTWCGRYSIPAGLMVSYYLAGKLSLTLEGINVGYRTSITLPPLESKDLKMGLTAPANLHHWVGYTAIGYK